MGPDDQDGEQLHACGRFPTAILRSPRSSTIPRAASIEVDVWRLEPAALGRFLQLVPPPLALGTVTLSDGSAVTGFVAEPRALDGALDITDLGGWRAYEARAGVR